MLLICHDSKLIMEDWCEEWGEDDSIGFLSPGLFLDYLRKNKGEYQHKKNVFLFDRQWQNKIDLVKDPIIDLIRKEVDGLSIKWVLASNIHEYGDKVLGWDFVKDGEAVPKKRLLEMMLRANAITEEEACAF